ncbi:MAG: GNAT family N-acetyltransferase [Solirubrobacteraceae bacterium]
MGNTPLAMGMPIEGYAAVRSTHPLSAAEANSFLAQARRGSGSRRLIVRGVDLGTDQVDWSFARRIGTASVIPVDPGSEPGSRYARLARRSLRRAESAGATVRASGDGEAFSTLYRAASASWEMRYPEALIIELGQVGVARFDEVLLGGQMVAGLMTLKAEDHWMCWLAAQSGPGREISASYLAYDRLLTDARAEVPCVNLGASAPGTGGGDFKRRLGAHERPIYEAGYHGLVAKLNDARASRRSRRRRASST